MCNIHIMGIFEEKWERKKRNIGHNNDLEFPQTTDPGSSQNMKQDICQQNKTKRNTPLHITFKLQIIKDKEEALLFQAP